MAALMLGTPGLGSGSIPAAMSWAMTPSQIPATPKAQLPPPGSWHGDIRGWQCRGGSPGWDPALLPGSRSLGARPRVPQAGDIVPGVYPGMEPLGAGSALAHSLGVPATPGDTRGTWGHPGDTRGTHEGHMGDTPGHMGDTPGHIGPHVATPPAQLAPVCH